MEVRAAMTTPEVRKQVSASTWADWQRHFAQQQADEQANEAECIPAQECECPPLDTWRHWNV